jgi:hypothetical protein
MHLGKALGLVELNEADLGRVTGSGLPGLGPGERGSELHINVSGPPVRGEIGGSYSGPGGGRVGGHIATDGVGWSAGISGSLTSPSGRSSVSGSATTDGHDWGVTATYVHRF